MMYKILFVEFQKGRKKKVIWGNSFTENEGEKENNKYILEENYVDFDLWNWRKNYLPDQFWIFLMYYFQAIYVALTKIKRFLKAM